MRGIHARRSGSVDVAGAGRVLDQMIIRATAPLIWSSTGGAGQHGQLLCRPAHVQHREPVFRRQVQLHCPAIAGSGRQYRRGCWPVRWNSGFQARVRSGMRLTAPVSGKITPNPRCRRCLPSIRNRLRLVVRDDSDIYTLDDLRGPHCQCRVPRLATSQQCRRAAGAARYRHFRRHRIPEPAA